MSHVYEKMKGCFGLPSIYHDDAPACQSCFANKHCRGQAFELGSRVHLTVNIERKLGKLVGPTDKLPPSLDVKQAKQARERKFGEASGLGWAHLPLKAQPIAESVHRRGIVPEMYIRSGLNPFRAQPPKMMRVACDMVLERNRFSRKELCQRLMGELGYTRPTAESQTTLAGILLQEWRVVRCVNNVFEKTTL